MNRLRELRQAESLTQEQLAERLGVSHSTVQRLEAGKVHLTDHYVMALARVLNIHPGELFAPMPSGRSDLERKIVDLVESMAPHALDAWLRIGADILAGSGEPAKPRRVRRGTRKPA